MTKNDISDRFIQVYNHLLSSNHVSDKKDFAAKIGISASMVTEISKGRSSVGITAIQNIVSSFHISSDWLLSGKGSMLKGDTYSNVLPIPSVPSENPAPHECIYKELLKEKDNEIKAQAKENGRLEAEVSTIKAETENLHAEIARLKALIEALEKREKSSFPASSQLPTESPLSEVPASILMAAEPGTEYRRRK